ncbi:MAG TPA: SPFH domain-containing protein [Xanthobacteraceae bacterium]|jgi:regulator of protease activity HflC (stomatin/prohibitin superfamily)
MTGGPLEDAIKRHAIASTPQPQGGLMLGRHAPLVAFMFLVGLVLLAIAFGSWYTIDQSQRGVLLRNGAFVDVVQPGLHFKWPLIDSVAKIDMQTHTFAWSKMESYSADQQPAHLKVSVTLHVAADKVAEMYSRFRGDQNAAVDRIIGPHLNEKVKVVFGQYTAARAISARGQLNADSAKALSEAIAYDPVFVIESVQIEDITFSPDYIKSVEQRMQAEVEVQKFRQQLEREKVQAEIVVTQAKGKADAVRAEALANADAVRFRGQADADAIKAKGAGEASAIEARGAADATAIRAKGDALGSNPQLVPLIQAQRWDGKLPVTMVPGGATPMLNLGQR